MDAPFPISRHFCYISYNKTVITQSYSNLSVNTFIRNKIHAVVSSAGYTTSAFKALAANAHDAFTAFPTNWARNGDRSPRQPFCPQKLCWSAPSGMTCAGRQPGKRWPPILFSTMRKSFVMWFYAVERWAFIASFLFSIFVFPLD